MGGKRERWADGEREERDEGRRGRERKSDGKEREER